MYAIPLSLSLVMVALLWNIALICRVQFSREKQVTKLTFIPYMISLCFLLAQLIECAMLEYSVENPKSRDGKIAPIFNQKFHRQLT